MCWFKHESYQDAHGILRKHTKTKIFHDTFFNIVGGLKIDESETCIDLALVTALLSSLNEFVVHGLLVLCLVSEMVEDQ